MNTPESPEITLLQQRLSDLEARYHNDIQCRDTMLETAKATIARQVEELGAVKAERASLLRCSKGHIHNQAYGSPCPICERDALRDGMEEFLAFVVRLHKLACAAVDFKGAQCDDDHEVQALRSVARDGEFELALSAAQALLSGAAPGEPSADHDSPTGTADDQTKAGSHD